MTGVLDPWTRSGTGDFLGPLKRARGRETPRESPGLDPDGWLVRIPALKHRENGRATQCQTGR